MMEHKEFSIPFSGLKQGKHQYKYQIENTFFESFEYEEFIATNITADVVLNIASTMLGLDFKANGTVNVLCDVTGEAFDQPVASEMRLVVKFGEAYNDEDDEILIIPHGEHKINVAQYIYEMLVLAVPPKRIHPGIADGTLESEALDRLDALRPKEIKENREDNDPRWDALKKLITDK